MKLTTTTKKKKSEMTTTITLRKGQRKFEGENERWEIENAEVNEMIFVTKSNNSTLEVKGRKAAKVVIERCTGCTIRIGCVLIAGIVEMIRCRECTVEVEKGNDVAIFQVDMCVDCRLVVPQEHWKVPSSSTTTTRSEGGILKHAIYSTSCTGLNVELISFVETATKEEAGTGGKTTTEIISIPDGECSGSSQVTHFIEEEGKLETEAVVWDGAGHATTKKEKEKADKRDEKLIEAVCSAFLKQQQQRK